MSASYPQSELSPLKRAFLKIEELQARLLAVSRSSSEPIAVIGAGCRFPGGADHPDALWRLLRDGVDATGPVPPGRWDVDAYYDPEPGRPGKMYCRRGGFLGPVDGFDPQLFGIAPGGPRDRPSAAASAGSGLGSIEYAGLSPERLRGSRTGVYVGLATGDYTDLQIKLGDPMRFDAYFGTGAGRGVASGRLAYVFGLLGPALSVDTACSSSLVAAALGLPGVARGRVRRGLGRRRALDPLSGLRGVDVPVKDDGP